MLVKFQPLVREHLKRRCIAKHGQSTETAGKFKNPQGEGKISALIHSAHRLRLAAIGCHQMIELAV